MPRSMRAVGHAPIPPAGGFRNTSSHYNVAAGAAGAATTGPSYFSGRSAGACSSSLRMGHTQSEARLPTA